MSAAALTAPPVPLLTAEEYMQLPDDGRRTELVRGRVVEMPQPKPTHGYYCSNCSGILRDFVRSHDLGRVVSNDSGVKTEKDPDTVRGPDVAFYSYAKVPKGPMPKGYWPTPELVVEVKSEFDRWPALLAKVSEYLAAGVVVVCVLDPESESLGMYTQDRSPRELTVNDELTLPEVLPDFRIAVRQFFE
jgi:Uma2 family endonuclease